MLFRSANQADEIIAADLSLCAKSIIQQAPLDGTKVALWVYLMTGVETQLNKRNPGFPRLVSVTSGNFSGCL